MKRLLLLFSLLCSNVYASTIDLPAYMSGNDVTIANLQTTNTTIENAFNGNIEGGINIKAGSLVSPDFSVSVSLVTFRDEAFNDFTFTGMLPVTSVDLTSNISAGTSYVSGFRIVKSATANTYTASKDTYVYIDEGGTYKFIEVANGAAAPSTPTGSLLLAKVVTSGSAITSVTDQRTTSIQITTTTTNFPADYRNQCYVSRDSATTMHVEPGTISIGNTIYSRTTDTSTKTVTTGSNWIEGGYSPGTPTTIFVYAYNDSGSTWDFKFSSADPVNSDTSSGTSGVLRYYSTGGVNYRAIGWAFLSNDTIQSYEFGNIKDIGVSNKAYRESTQANTISATSYDNQLSEAEINYYTTGGTVTVYGNIYCSANSGNPNPLSLVVSNNGGNLTKQETAMDLAGNPNSLNNSSMFINPQGSYKVQLRSKVAAGSATISQKSLFLDEG